MTDLRKVVRRRAVSAAYRGRRLVIALHPGDLIGLREERTRREYFLPVGYAYQVAVRLEVERRKRAKAEAKKARKAVKA